MRFNVTPGASGVVMDSQSRAPLAGARVAISLAKYPAPSLADALEVTRPPVVTTDTAGRFYVPADHRWGIYILPVDRFPEFGLLTVQHNGYDPLLVPLWSHSVTNLGQILLTPAAPQRRSSRNPPQESPDAPHLQSLPSLLSNSQF